VTGLHVDGATAAAAISARSSPQRQAADVICVLSPRSLLRHPRALMITALAASDLAYRLLLREAVRRSVGMDARVTRALGAPDARRSAGGRWLRR
jgi:hypothetical protein